MARPRSLLLRALFAGVAVAVAAAGWVAWSGRGPAAGFLPGGAFLAAEVRDAAGILDAIEGTRFAAAFERSSTREWLDRTEALRALDGVRAAVGSAVGVTPGRRAILDHAFGRDAAVAWYRGPGPAAPGAWVASFRLSWPAWALASAGRAAGGLGMLPAGISREEIADIPIYSVSAGRGAPLHLFARGRTVVAGTDRERIGAAARCASGGEDPLAKDPRWRAVRERLPEDGNLFLWVDGDTLPPAAARALGGVPLATGALLRGGRRTELHVYTEMASRAPLAAEASALPALAFLGSRPLLLVAAAGPAPEALRALIAARARDAARAGAPADRPLPAARSGYALVVRDASASGLFPMPRGALVLGMGGEAEANDAVRLLFPPGARTAQVKGRPAYATRESFPLAGEFELWGGAVGPWLALGTSPEELAAVDAKGGGLDAGELEGVVVPGRRLDAVAALDVGKALPVLRRYAPPLGGLLSARYRDVPDLARDLDLLAAVRSVTAYAVSAPEGPRALVTVQFGDLP